MRCGEGDNEVGDVGGEQWMIGEPCFSERTSGARQRLSGAREGSSQAGSVEHFLEDQPEESLHKQLTVNMPPAGIEPALRLPESRF